MNKTRFVAKCIAGTVGATVLAMATLAAPAQAAKDTGWGPVAPRDGGTFVKMSSDTGWGP
ncbi:MAG TPA: hypothetical protein VFM50_03650 [Nocardioidaceae bacterium]|jgi:hypothetical protein|nr:hypothetical protein [Nocardioidaceae bacterium]